MSRDRSIFAGVLVVVVGIAVYLGLQTDDSQRPVVETQAPATTPASVASTTTTAAPDPWLSTVAEALNEGELPIYPAAGAAEPDRFLTHPTPIGAPLTFLVKEDHGEWLEVYLPMRPNGSTGFVQRAALSLTEHRFHITVTLAEFKLQVFWGDDVLLDTDIGVARDNAPTPGGLYFTTELLAPPNPNGPYGPYAYGLSGFSDTFETFNGGPGQLGIHGTDQPDVIGTKVSSGCIRLHNDDVTRMAEEIGLPLGVPVTIIA